MVELPPITAPFNLVDLARVYDVRSAKGNGVNQRELYEHISRILAAEQQEGAYGIVLTALSIDGTDQKSWFSVPRTRKRSMSVNLQLSEAFLIWSAKMQLSPPSGRQIGSSNQCNFMRNSA